MGGEKKRVPVPVHAKTMAPGLVVLPLILLLLARPRPGLAQLNAPGGTYAGYRMRQNCDPAGGYVLGCLEPVFLVV